MTNRARAHPTPGVTLSRYDLVGVLGALHEEPFPKTRGECVGAARPCMALFCRHNLYLDVNRSGQGVKFNFPDRKPRDMPPGRSCALDIADRGPSNLDRVGEMMNMTRERVRQIQEGAIAKLGRHHLPILRELAGR